MGIVIPLVGFHGGERIRPVPGGIETRPGAGFDGGELLNPCTDSDVLDTNSLGGPFLQFFLQVFNKGEGAGFRSGPAPGGPVPGQGIGKVLKTFTLPFPADFPGQTAGTVDCYLKSF
jgi:hypothetical protein